MIPMAVSLGFGVVFATFITLVLVPSIYVILEDIKSFLFKILGRHNIDVTDPPVSATAPTSGGQK